MQKRTITRRARELWGWFMEEAVGRGIPETEYKLLTAHRAVAIEEDGVLVIAPPNARTHETSRHGGYYRKWQAIAGELDGIAGLALAGWHLNAGRRKLRKPPEAPLAAPEISTASPHEIAWLHAVWAQVGLPRSRPRDAQGADLKRFTRRSGGVALTVHAGFGLDDMREHPLPFGSKPRLMLADICTSAVRSRSPIVDIGSSVREYLERLGLQVSGGRTGSYTSFKRQAQALAACRMQLHLDYSGRRLVYKGDPIRQFEAWATDDATRQPGLWPGTLRLDQEFYDALVEFGLPISLPAYRALSQSPMAMDAYTWLAHRLWRIDGAVDVRWEALHRDYGQEYLALPSFKQKFTRAIKAAQAVYPESVDRIQSIPGGLRLHHAPPPVPFRTPPRRLAHRTADCA